MKQEAGKKTLGDLAPEFAHLNDDILFGEVWSREGLSLRDRTIVTVSALISKGITDSSLEYHILNAKKEGVSKTEMVEIITHLAFYAGWPNAWAAFPLVRKAYSDETSDIGRKPLFGLGEENIQFGKYFIGKSYLKPLNLKGVGAFNVTFEPGCRNDWHIHHLGGQILLATDGTGWYQEWGQKARKLVPGDVVYIAPEVKHWHGAAKDQWFTHIALEIPKEGSSTEWLEEVTSEQYDDLVKKQ